MGFRESMMNFMMGNMSSDEKKAMMDRMMENFFSGMSDEEKQAMMREMMPKMMENMMKGGGGMMNMMGKMMGQKREAEGGGFNPMDMCRQMMSSMGEGRNTESFATPELQNLFKDWLQQINEEILGFMSEHQSASVDQIAEHIKLSPDSVIYLLGTLAQEGKVKLTAEVITV